MKLLVTFTAILLTCQLWGQTIRVLDRSDLQPVDLVMVYNQSQKNVGFTNRYGDVKMKDLNPGDTLVFQHASFQELSLTYAEIKLNRHQVLLSLRAYDLGQLTVSAHRWEQRREDVPVRITLIPAREIAFQNPQTAADLIACTREVFVQKSQLGGGSPMLRGFAANSVLLVVDGIRMNNAIYRSGNLQNVISLDPNFIENTEVHFGPGSVIYGSDAMGGVMIFNTVQPRLAIDDTLVYRVKPMVRYSSANNEKTAGILIKAGVKKWGSATSFTISDFGDLQTGSNRSSRFPDQGKRFEYVFFTGTHDSIMVNPDANVLVPSGYSQWNIAQKIRYRPGENADLVYGFQYSATSDIPRYDRLIEYRQGKLRYAEWYYGPQKWMMHNLQLRLLGENRIFDNTKITISYQFSEESRHDRKLNDLQRTSRTEKVHAFILNADFEKSPGATKIFYGFEGYYNRVHSLASTLHILSGHKSPASTRYPDGQNHYGSLAAYGFLKKPLNEHLVMNTGVRYSYVLLHSTLIDTMFYHFPFRMIDLNTGFLNGSLGLTMHPSKALQLNANLSTGFRSPNLDDAGKIFESEPGNVVVPNPGLRPEYTLNSEFGIIYTGADLLRLEVNLFHTWLFDVMVRRNFQYLGQDSMIYNGELSKVQAIVNAGQGEIAGVFADLRFNLNKDFSISSSFTYTYGREKGNEGNIPLNHIPPIFGATTLDYSGKRTRIEASLVYNAAKKWDDLDPSEQAKIFIYTEEGSLAWFILNLKVAYQILPELQLNAGIENITNKHYWPYASGIPAPGRNVYLSLRGNVSR